MSRYHQGIFKPNHPQKYVGTQPIVYRSGWEFKFMRYCDGTPGIVRWASESNVIPYISPVDGQSHRYFVDFRIDVQTRDGSVKTMLIEIKPKVQQAPPKQPKRRTRKYLSEVATFAINQAKWTAATKHARARGWQFMVLNEDHLDVHGS